MRTTWPVEELVGLTRSVRSGVSDRSQSDAPRKPPVSLCIALPAARRPRILSNWCYHTSYQTGWLQKHHVKLVLSCISNWWDSLLVTALDSWSKGSEFESWQERQENFLLGSQLCVLTLIQCQSPPPPMLPQWHVKDPNHSAKSAGGRLHLNTHTPLTIEVGVGWLCHWTGRVWESIRKRAHTQLIRKHSVTVISACWTTVDWSWLKEWN